MDLGLRGKVAIVTGSAGGIGRVYANALARAGASVVVADLNEGGAAEVAAHLGDDGLAAIGVRVDITDPGSAGAMAAAATAANFLSISVPPVAANRCYRAKLLGSRLVSSPTFGQRTRRARPRRFRA